MRLVPSMQVNAQNGAVDNLVAMGLGREEALTIQGRLSSMEDDVYDPVTGVYSKEVHIVTSLGQNIDLSETYRLADGVLPLDLYASDILDVTCAAQVTQSPEGFHS